MYLRDIEIFEIRVYKYKGKSEWFIKIYYNTVNLIVSRI